MGEVAAGGASAADEDGDSSEDDDTGNDTADENVIQLQFLNILRTFHKNRTKILGPAQITVKPACQIQYAKPHGLVQEAVYSGVVVYSTVCILGLVQL